MWFALLQSVNHGKWSFSDDFSPIIQPTWADPSAGGCENAPRNGNPDGEGC